MSKNNNCCDTATITGGYTPIDLKNASLYAQYKWYKNRCDQLGTGGINVKWFPTYTTGQVSYNCPEGLTCEEGSCRIQSEEECMKWNFYPYTTDTAGTPLEGTGMYLEYREDSRFPQLGPNCFVGNAALKNWCISPEARKPSDSSSKPFAYDASSGKCFLTKQYCDREGESYSSPDPPGFPNRKFTPDYYNQNPMDVGGKCTQSEGMEFAEDLFGNTLTRGFSSGCILSDRKYKRNITNIGKDYIAPGIHLYYFNYIPEVRKIHPEYTLAQVGFMADEVKKVFPEVIKKIEGRDYLYFDEKLLKDKKYWRMFNTLKYKNLISRKLLLYLSKIKDE